MMVFGKESTKRKRGVDVVVGVDEVDTVCVSVCKLSRAYIIFQVHRQIMFSSGFPKHMVGLS